ncbi:coiled-coil domain-containing protein 194 [Vulpes lagopus]|uniref:coiled-coil domain-containing protein 194 n=1 Tax=Vulpes lagopus TaxID=494514 RepID=UPI001BCA4F8C|nr:coiled-coil domain-containing protein 194 [Vulpes lagopus]
MGILTEYPQCRWVLGTGALMVPTGPRGQELRPLPLHRGADSEAQRTAHGVQRRDWNPRPATPPWARGAQAGPWRGSSPLPADSGSHGREGRNRGCPWCPKVPISCSRLSGARAVDGGMAELGPEPGRAWRVLALCGAAVFLAAAAAGAALLAWNLASAASRGPRCPEPGANATAPPRDLAPEVEELQRRLAEATQREDALARRLDQANRARGELEEALRACQGRQSRLQTQLMTLKTEIDEAKAQETQMGAENGALTEALARWEAAATESARRLDEAQQRARAAEAEAEACAAREAVLRERAKALEAELGPQRRVPRPRSRSVSRPRPRPSPRSRSRPGPSGGCRRPARRARG